MPIYLIKILCFLGAAIGILLLLLGIKLLQRVFNGTVLVNVPCSVERTPFVIEKPGSYDIWQGGRLFGRTALSQFDAVICDTAGRPVRQYGNLGQMLLHGTGRAHTNNGTTGRVKMKTYVLPAGKYQLVCQNKWVSGGLFNRKPADPASYSFQLRPSPPPFYMAGGIFLCVLSGIIIIGGMVAGFVI